VLVNTVFDLGVGFTSLLRGLIVAALLRPTQYGVWGVLVASLGVLAQLKLVGISDKYIQQDEEDQELAFQRAFTLELAISLTTMVLVAAAVPVLCVVYGHWSLLGTGLVLVTILLADALQSPLWIYYRRMDFFRQRMQAAVEPIIGLVVAVTLAALGFGYWALALGAVAGAWSAAIVAIKMSPYPLRWRWSRGALRVYSSFSLPILAATLCSVALANGTVLATNIHLGLAGVGAVAVAGNITSFTTSVDDLVASTIYPAICAVQDQIELLRESFVKTNRMALLWAMPFGVGVALFARALIHLVLGDKWQSAATLMQVTGLVAAANHIGFNWDDYYRARADTRPVGIATLVTTIVTLGAGIPLLFAMGLTGLGIGLGAGAVTMLLLRAFYLTQLFHGFRFVRHALRAALPTLPAAAVVLVIRLLGASSQSAGATIVQLAAFVVVLLVASWAFERELIAEALAYVRARAVPPGAPTTDTTG
jgi:O-antigen/teichoic acid export membrane protein